MGSLLSVVSKLQVNRRIAAWFVAFVPPSWLNHHDTLVNPAVARDSMTREEWLNHHHTHIDVLAARSTSLTGRLTPEERDLHRDGGKLVMNFWRKIDDECRDSEPEVSVIDVKKRMLQHTCLQIHDVSDRTIFEFAMEDKNGNKKFFVGKRFTLVRMLSGDIESRKKIIRNEYKRVLRELHIWRKLKHDNFVRLRFVSFDTDSEITAVSERMDTDVRNSFHNTNFNIDYVKVIKGIANGLAFLHNFTGKIATDNIEIEAKSVGSQEEIRGIVHSDVKCQNVLLRAHDSTPFLTDFGVTHELEAGIFTKTFNTTGVYAAGTLYWMAPELLRRSDEQVKVTHTKKSDVWSFGMTIYEIVAKKNPWNDIEKNSCSPEDAQNKVMEVTQNKKLPDWPSSSDMSRPYSNGLEKIFMNCCKLLPSDRLKMDDVVTKLNGLSVIV